MKTNLLAVSAYIPPTGVHLETAGPALGLSELDIRMFVKFYGLRDVRVDAGAGLHELLVAAAKGIGTLAWAARRVRYVIHARTIQPVGPYSANPLLEVRRTLGLEHSVGLAVTQHACASGLLAVDLAGRLLAAQGDRDALALVLTGEKAYPHVNQQMPVPTVMGESAAACLIGGGDAGDRLLSYVWHTDGAYRASTEMSAELRQQFQRDYPDTLAGVILAAVRKAGLELADLSMILPHNVNRVSWVRVARLIGYPVERIYLANVPLTGHSFCADPFVNYACALEQDQLAPGDHYLMVSVGLGAVFAAMVFRHRGTSS